jgi:hypothetical protein
MKLVALMPFQSSVHGELAELVGGDKIQNDPKNVPVLDFGTNKVSNMPEPKEDTVYVVAGTVFQRLKQLGRKDIAMFDNNKTIRFPQGHKLEGKAKSQGGLIFA